MARTAARRSKHPAHGRVAGAIAVGLALAGPAQAQSAFMPIPGIPGFGPSRTSATDPFATTDVVPTAISADGSTVVGHHGYTEGRSATNGSFRYVQYTAGGTQAFRWTGAGTTGLGYTSNATGIVSRPLSGPVGPSVGTRVSYATGVSADGRTVVGYGGTGCLASCVTTLEPTRAFVWTAETGLREFEGFLGAATTRALGVSGDGRVVVGESGARAFAWTQSGGIRQLPGLSDATATAVAASYDGSVIVGSSTRAGDYDNSRATLWRRDGSALDLGSLPGTNASYATDVSADGRVVSGSSWAGGSLMAVRWTAEAGMTALGVLPGSIYSRAFAISGDGRVIVGESSRRAFRWSETTGLQSVAGWLAAAGVQVPSGTVLETAQDTSYDGSVVIGTYRAGDVDELATRLRAYLARVGDAGSGFLADVDAFRDDVAATGARSLLAAGGLADLASAGARHHGAAFAWPPADDARGCASARVERSRPRDGGPEFDVRELAACAMLGRLRLSAGGGHVEARSDGPLDGSSRHDGRYGLLGASATLDGGWVFALTAHRGSFDARTERRYLSGTRVDSSTGSTDGEFDAVVARIDWTGMAEWGRVRLDPYVVHARSEVELDAYTETGGGFPVAYGDSRIEQHETAIGAVARIAFTPRTTLAVGVEGARSRYRLPDGVPAQVIGLFDTSMSSASWDDDSTRASLHLEQALGAGVDVRAGVRSTIGGDRRRDDVSLQLRATF